MGPYNFLLFYFQIILISKLEHTKEKEENTFFYFESALDLSKCLGMISFAPFVFKIAIMISRVIILVK